MRIAVFHNLHSGGAKRVAGEHLARLSERHVVQLFSLRQADHAFAAIDSSARPPQLYDYRGWPMAPSPWGRINPLLGLLNVARMAGVARRIAHRIDADHFDVVLVHPCQMTAAPLVLRWLKTPSVYYCQELPRRLYEKPVWRPYATRTFVRRTLDQVDLLARLMAPVMRWVDRTNALSATELVCNSLYTQANLQQAYHRTAEVCAPAVSVPADFPLQLGPRERCVLSVGALTPNKGFDFVIQALGTLDDDERPPLVIISNYQEPQELQYLTGLAQAVRVEVKFLSRISEDELWRWYARAACLAYAPVREPYGLAVLEAMAAGAAVVGVAEGGVVETVQDGKTGLLAPREAKAFGQAVRQMLAQPEMAQRLCLAALDQVRLHRRWEDHMAQLEKILRAGENHASGRKR